MRAFVKIAVKIVASVLVVGLVLIGSAIAFVRWQFHLPSAAKAKAYFNGHKVELENLVLAVGGDYDIDFVDARWIGYGSAARDPAHIACAELLKKMRAKFLKHDRGVVEIYFWGSGCPICHDSYKGFAWVRDPSFNMPLDSKICASLDDRALPRGKDAPVENGTYLVPIADHWYLVRWENG